MKYANIWELLAFVFGSVIAFSLLFYFGAATVRYFKQPYQPPKLTLTEQSVLACVNQGGVPIVVNKQVDEDGDFHDIFLDRCDKIK